MDLKFDKMSVDTSLARDYLRRELNSLGRTFDAEQYKTENLPSYLKELAIKLKENTDLIVQLEYFVREIPTADTIVQLGLIIQQTKYVSLRSICLKRPLSLFSLSSNVITLRNDSPLLLLGNIAKMMQYGNAAIYLQHDNKPKEICTLIANLCQDIGLPVFTKAAETEAVPLGIYQVPIGTVSVVSENSDVESAVDILLASSNHVPWRLQKILVQESVYQQFLSALSWKCKLYKQKNLDSSIPSSDVLEYNGRVFQLDLAGSTELNPQTVIVEAYRTRKELKLLLNQYRPHYLSLWANDISEINEIAYSIPSPIVWVNNIGDFRGPPKITEALFYHEDDPKTIDVKGLKGLKDSWLKLDFETRRKILCKALDECCTHVAKITIDDIKDNLQRINIDKSSAFIEIGKDHVCIGISVPSNRLFYKTTELISADFFESVLLGNAFVINLETNAQLVDIFTKAGIPIIRSEPSDESANDSVVHHCGREDGENFFTDITHNIKVIWTNSGTVFAN